MTTTSESLRVWPALLDQVFFYYGQFFWMFCVAAPSQRQSWCQLLICHMTSSPVPVVRGVDGLVDDHVLHRRLDHHHYALEPQKGAESQSSSMSNIPRSAVRLRYQSPHPPRAGLLSDFAPFLSNAQQFQCHCLSRGCSYKTPPGSPRPFEEIQSVFVSHPKLLSIEV